MALARRTRVIGAVLTGLLDDGVMPDGSPAGDPSPDACPGCHGVLNTVPDPGVLRSRCRTGHAWSAESLVAQQDTDVEEALWTALRVLEERAEMSRRVADMATTSGREWSQEHFLSRAADADRSAGLLRAVLRRDSEQPTIPTSAAGPSPPRPPRPPEDLHVPGPAPLDEELEALLASLRDQRGADVTGHQRPSLTRLFRPGGVRGRRADAQR